MTAGQDATCDRSPIRLGLIGDHISRSRAPELHRIAGNLIGLKVTYDLFDPRETGTDFDAVLSRCRKYGFRGLNITHPYKQRVIGRITGGDPIVQRIGSANTVLFTETAVEGFNTDHSGFIAAYRGAFADAAPGRVALLGAGGVGRAVAFALAALHASEIRIIDRDLSRAESLAVALARSFEHGLVVTVHDDPAACAGADAVANCTPVGMGDDPGSAVAAAHLSSARWAFDAVYTPVETRFKADAEAAGARFLSGYELFFAQGVDAFRIFTGRSLTHPEALRQRLSSAETEVGR
ncbi:MAG: shikimate dehydrogenase [Hyphomicrobiales bacterium]|nr:shikimate dehydrogenase [Hyphomicrobiales bacterium]